MLVLAAIGLQFQKPVHVLACDRWGCLNVNVRIETKEGRLVCWIAEVPTGVYVPRDDLSRSHRCRHSRADARATPARQEAMNSIFRSSVGDYMQTKRRACMYVCRCLANMGRESGGGGKNRGGKSVYKSNAQVWSGRSVGLGGSIMLGSKTTIKHPSHTSPLSITRHHHHPHYIASAGSS